MIQPSAGSSALGAAPAAESHRVLRMLALVAVSLGVVVLAAAAFVLSYHGIRAIALEAGVSPDLARIYPLIFDVMLVVAGAAVLSLRGAGWIVQAFAWLSLLVLLAAAAGASTLYATNTHLPHKTAATIAAILPWALALLGFFLLLAMLRHARLRRAQSRRATSAAAVAQEADTIPGAVPARRPGPTATGRTASTRTVRPGPTARPPNWPPPATRATSWWRAVPRQTTPTRTHRPQRRQPRRARRTRDSRRGRRRSSCRRSGRRRSGGRRGGRGRPGRPPLGRHGARSGTARPDRAGEHRAS